MMTQKDFEVTQPPTDGISHLSFSPVADFLACSSWDNQVRIWEVQPSGNTVPKSAIQHDAPSLCTAWSPTWILMKDGNQLFSGGASRQGKLFDLASGQSIAFAQHDQPIKSAHFFSTGPMQNILATASWDKTIKYWDPRAGTSVGFLQLPERCYTMSVTYPLLTVGTAERHVVVVNLQEPNKIFKTMTSPLKYQTRVIANFPDKSGFMIGSVEGRVACQYMDDKDSSDGNNVFAINNISFHPTYGTFSTCGSDGTFNFWDKDSKQRLKNFNNVGAPIVSSTFNRTGSIFAYAASYDWSKGHEFRKPDDKDKIFLHPVSDEDIKPKGTKKR